MNRRTIGLAAALILQANICSGDDLGRLFTTRSERDALRNQAMRPQDFSLEKAELAPVFVDGVLIPDKGDRIRWINKERSMGSEMLYPGVEIRSSEIARRRPAIQVWTEGLGTLTLKPGQVWFPRENRVKERFSVDSRATESGAEQDSARLGANEDASMTGIPEQEAADIQGEAP